MPRRHQPDYFRGYAPGSGFAPFEIGRPVREGSSPTTIEVFEKKEIARTDRIADFNVCIKSYEGLKKVRESSGSVSSGVSDKLLEPLIKSAIGFS